MWSRILLRSADESPPRLLRPGNRRLKSALLSTFTLLKPNLVHILFLAALAVILAGLVWRYRNIQVDDAYITYRYARNLASGSGFAYNPPQPVLGTTTPLYTLLLSLAAVLGMDIPSASLVFGGASLFVLAVLFYFFSRDQSRRSMAHLPALLVVFMPGSVLILGMETALYAALIYTALYAAAHKRYALAVILAALATLTRYDGILVAVLALFYEWYATKSFPLKNGLLYAGILLPWLVYATLTFGSPLPNTFFAKTGELSGNVFVDELSNNVLTLLGFLSLQVVPGWLAGLVLLALCVAAWLAGKSAFVRLIAAWCGVYLAAYALLRIRYTFHWYYYPFLPGLLLASMDILQTAREKTLEKFNWLSAQVLTVLVLVPLLLTVALGSLRLLQQADTAPALGSRNKVYALAAEWICRHTPEQATVAVPEIGLIGWHCDRPIVDPFGLVSPEMIPFIQSGDKLGGVVALRPDVIVITNVPKDEQPFNIPEPERFADEYVAAHVIEERDYPYFLVIFEKSESQ